MGSFYRVVKTIKGHRYLYKQRTFRLGGRVCTESHYLGPAGAGDAVTVQAEQAIRRKVPNLGQVAAVVQRLADPARASPTWSKYWSAPGAVNTTFQSREAIDRQVAALGVILLEHPDAEGAAYNLGHDAVVMPARQRFAPRPGCSAEEGFYVTLMHELTHWTSHAARLDRTVIGQGQIQDRAGFETYAREELVAEATAVLVLGKLGLPVQDFGTHANYFQDYLSPIRNKEDALEYVINESHRAAGYILASPQLIALKVQYGLV